jgi:hypothetical protein
MSPSDPATMVHIAGACVQVGTHLRQRCSWCGGILVDEDLARIAVPVGQEGDYPTWPVGALIRTTHMDPDSSGVTHVVEHVDGQPVPDDCCAKLSPEVTA